MAIVEMKKVRLLAMNKDRPKILRALQKLGCVQIQEGEQSEQPDGDLQERIDELTKLQARFDLCIAKLSAHEKDKQPMFTLRQTADAEKVEEILAKRKEIEAVVTRVEETERLLGETRGKEAKEKATIDALTPWSGLDIPLENVRDTKTAKVCLLQLSAREYSAFSEGIAQIGCACTDQVYSTKDSVYLIAAVHKTAVRAFSELVENTGAVTVSFPEGKGTAKQQIENARQELENIEKQRVDIAKEIEDLALRIKELRILRDADRVELDRLEASAKFTGTRSAFIMEGWAPAKREEEIRKALSAITSAYEMEFTEPEEGETPPTYLQNGRTIAPFESIVKMFSLPDPNGLDPTFIMTPFWVCFFGMMVSDAGYGIIMGIVCAYLSHRLKRHKGMGQMTFILALGGISTVFWGAMYGGWFGEEFFPPLLFAPMDNPIGMLVLSLAMGCVHLVAGMCVAAYMNIKRGKPWDALFDQGFWLLLLAGLGLLLVNSTVGGIIALIGGVGILFTAGRAKENFFKRITGGLGALYGITSYVSDILSYARLFGMGLATGVIGMVVNTLAMMPWGSPVGCVCSILILVFGHALNLAINALGAYVHSCRLQYIEFFNKFYESGGKDFTPLSTENTRYVDIEA